MAAEALSPRLSPSPQSSVILLAASSTKGRFARRREEDGVAVSRGPDGHIRHSGDAGAPPGTTTSPCQELADDLSVALPASGLLERVVCAFKHLGLAQRSDLKRGPALA